MTQVKSKCYKELGWDGITREHPFDCRRMQPRVTVALATVWLTVAVLIGGAVTLHLSHDQYSPASPRRHAGIQRDRTRDWKDHDSAEDQPLDLWIGSRRSISKGMSDSTILCQTEQNKAPNCVPLSIQGLMSNTKTSFWGHIRRSLV